MTDARQTIRILVAAAEGSAPREAGAVMYVTADGFDGTIGGGALEHAAMAAARELLARGDIGDWYRELRSYPLGPSLGQCCGGMVRLLFEVEGPLPSPLSGGAGGGGQNAERAKESFLQPPPGALAPASPQGGGGAIGLLIRPVAPGLPPVTVRDRAHTANWPLPVLRAVRQMLSGNRPRQTLLIAGGKGAPAFVIEPEPRPPHPLFLYGAGHVGRAVVRVLQDLPFAITWIDTAAYRFTDWAAAPGTTPHPVPLAKGVGLIVPRNHHVNVSRDGIRVCIAPNPAAIAAAAPPEALHLIMTFSHALDLAITAAVLARPHAWAGLIGSATKRARFEKRLREAGIDERAIGRLNCPIGIGGITGKEPAMIAVSVAAQLAAWASAGGMASGVEANEVASTR